VAAGIGQASDERADALLATLGFARWRPGQKEAVEAALEGRDSASGPANCPSRTS